MTRISRVVVVDDSAMMRRTVSDVLAGIAGVEIVGEAASGPQAIEVIAGNRPDIVSLDIELPGLNGLAVLDHVMKESPTRVILVSSYTTRGAATTMEGLALGALDFVPKPSTEEGLDVFKIRLRHAFRSALRAKLPHLVAAPDTGASAPKTLSRITLAVIASSTGGPRALNDFFSAFEVAPGYPIAVVQHMPPKFTQQMADRLDGIGPIRVSEAADGNPLRAGEALVAPGTSHMEIRGQHVYLTDEPPIGGLRPRADVTMQGAADSHGAGTLGVVLTGMGTDGLIGCRAIKQAGGQVVAQDGPSSTVDGMPAAIRRAGIADHAGPPAELGHLLSTSARSALASRKAVAAGRRDN